LTGCITLKIGAYPGSYGGDIEFLLGIVNDCGHINVDEEEAPD